VHGTPRLTAPKALAEPSEIELAYIRLFANGVVAYLDANHAVPS
jgi:hypothetical protein